MPPVILPPFCQPFCPDPLSGKNGKIVELCRFLRSGHVPLRPVMHRPGLRSSLALRQPAGRNHSRTLRPWRPKSVPSPSAKDAAAALRPRRPAAPEPTGRNRPMSGRIFCRLRGRNVVRPFRPIKPAPRLDSASGQRLSSQGGPVLCCAAAWWRPTLGTSFAILGRFFLQAIFMDRGKGAAAPPASPLPTPGAMQPY